MSVAASGEATLGTGLGECQASFGELLQGALPGGEKFLVNLRIENLSRVAVKLLPTRYSESKESEFARSYALWPKTHKTVRSILIDLGRHDDYALTLDREVPVGKGLSSSTADMVAAIRGLESALSVSFKLDYVSTVLTEIEPNDGLHYPGTTAYLHTKGQVVFTSDYVPPYRVLGLDLGGSVDTLEFNKREFAWCDEEMASYEKLLDETDKALRAEDSHWLARIATESLERWQKKLPKPGIDRVLELAGETDALGVVNTHSGTFVGLLYPPNRGEREALRRHAEAALPDVSCRWFATSGVAAQATGR